MATFGFIGWIACGTFNHGTGPPEYTGWYCEGTDSIPLFITIQVIVQTVLLMVAGLSQTGNRRLITAALGMLLTITFLAFEIFHPGSNVDLGLGFA